MLHEGERLIKPQDILKQIPADNYDAVVVLCLGKIGKPNALYMSTLTINELSFLAQSLQAEMTIRLGSMQEGS